MKVELKKLPKSEVELTITVPHDFYKKWEKKALEEISKELKVAGFRPGNIPEDIIRQQVRPEGIKSATLDFVIPQSYSEAVQKNEIQAIAQPQVDIVKDVEKDGDEFVYKVIVPVMPEVEMGDYKKIKVEKKPVKVEKKSIDDTVKMILDRQATWKDVTRKAGKEDRAEVNFEGFDEEGKPIPNTASKNHPVILGSATMVPGFEDGIIGMEIGEEKEIEVEFPKDYHAAAMQGKKVKFKITLNRLEEKEAQKLDEAMIEKVTGQKQTEEAFRALIEEDLQAELEKRGQQEHENKVVAEIIKITKAELPEALVAQELTQMMDEQKARAKQQGLEWEQYLTHLKKTEDDFKKDHRKTAEDRILARLGVQRILKEAEIEASDEETEVKIKELSEKYPKDQRDSVIEHYMKDKQAFQYMKNSLAADKLFDMMTK